MKQALDFHNQNNASDIKDYFQKYGLAVSKIEFIGLDDLYIGFAKGDIIIWRKNTDLIHVESTSSSYREILTRAIRGLFVPTNTQIPPIIRVNYSEVIVYSVNHQCYCTLNIAQICDSLNIAFSGSRLNNSMNVDAFQTGPCIYIAGVDENNKLAVAETLALMGPIKIQIREHDLDRLFTTGFTPSKILAVYNDEYTIYIDKPPTAVTVAKQNEILLGEIDEKTSIQEISINGQSISMQKEFALLLDLVQKKYELIEFREDTYNLGRKYKFSFNGDLRAQIIDDEIIFINSNKTVKELLADINRLLLEEFNGDEVIRPLPIRIGFKIYYINAELRQLKTFPSGWSQQMSYQLADMLGIDLVDQESLNSYLAVIEQLPGVWLYKDILVELDSKSKLDHSCYIFVPGNKNLVCGVLRANWVPSAHTQYKSLYVKPLFTDSGFITLSVIHNILETQLLDLYITYLPDILSYFFDHTQNTPLYSHVITKLAQGLNIEPTEENILEYIRSNYLLETQTEQLRAILVFVLVHIYAYIVHKDGFGIYSHEDMIIYLLECSRKLGINISDPEAPSLIFQPTSYLEVNRSWVPNSHVKIYDLPPIDKYSTPFNIASTRTYWSKVFAAYNLQIPITINSRDKEFHLYRAGGKEQYQLLVYLQTALKFGRYLEVESFLKANEDISLELLNYLYMLQRDYYEQLSGLHLAYLALSEHWNRVINERYGCQPWEISETILGSKNHYYLATPAFFDQEFWSIDTQAFTSQAQGELSHTSDSLEENLWQILESAIPAVKNRVTQSKWLKSVHSVRSSALGQKAGVILQGKKEQMRDHLLKLRSLTKEERTLLSLLGRVERHIDAISQVYSSEKITLAELKLFINAALKRIPYLVPANVKAILNDDNLDDNQELYFPLVSLFTQSHGILTILEELMLNDEGQVLVFFLISSALLQIGSSRRERINKNHMIVSPVKNVNASTHQDIILLINELKSNCLNNAPEFQLEICKLISNRTNNTNNRWILLNFMEQVFIPGIGEIFLPKFLLLSNNHKLLSQYLELVRLSGIVVANEGRFEYRSMLMEIQKEPTLLYGILDQDSSNLVETDRLSINVKDSEKYSSQRIYAVQEYVLPEDNALSIYVPSNTKTFKVPEGFEVLALIDCSSMGASTSYYQQVRGNVIKLFNPNNLPLKLVIQDTRKHLSNRFRVVLEKSAKHSPRFTSQPLLLNSQSLTGSTDIDYLIIEGLRLREQILSYVSREELTPDLLEGIILNIKELMDHLFSKLSQKHFYGIDPINNTGYDFINYRNGKDNRQLWIIALTTTQMWEFNCETAEMICASYIQSILGLQTGKANVQILKKKDNALLLKSKHTYTMLDLGLGYSVEIDLTLNKCKDVKTESTINGALAPEINESLRAEIDNMETKILRQKTSDSEENVKLKNERKNYKYNFLRIANWEKITNNLIRKLKLAEQGTIIALEPLEEQIIALLTKYLPLTIEPNIVFNFLYFYDTTEFSPDSQSEQYVLDPINKQVLIKVFKIPRQIIEEPNGERNAQLLVKAAITPNTQLQDTLSGARKFIMPAVNSKYLEIQREIQILIIRLKSILNVIKDIQSKNET